MPQAEAENPLEQWFTPVDDKQLAHIQEVFTEPIEAILQGLVTDGVKLKTDVEFKFTIDEAGNFRIPLPVSKFLDPRTLVISYVSDEEIKFHKEDPDPYFAEQNRPLLEKMYKPSAYPEKFPQNVPLTKMIKTFEKQLRRELNLSTLPGLSAQEFGL
jgi:hypothetical protein